MRVAVNTKSLFYDSQEGSGYFLYETLLRITQNHPEHEFVFIFDRTPSGTRFHFAPNITIAVTGPAGQHPLLQLFWNDFRLPALLRKHKADVFITIGSRCSSGTAVPQCFIPWPPLLINELKKQDWKNVRANKHPFLQARSIAALSIKFQEELIHHFAVPAEKVNVVFRGVPAYFMPASTEQRERTKSKLSEGKEYFLLVRPPGTVRGVIVVLKAFSLFKKRLQSNIKLVIASQAGAKDALLKKNLKTYKYRDDVILADGRNGEPYAKMLAAAYALIQLDSNEQVSTHLLEAMQCEVPAIAAPLPENLEIAGNAALFAAPDEPADIAGKMMQLFKDEANRSGLIRNGKATAAAYTWDRTAALLWQCIEKAAAPPPAN